MANPFDGVTFAPIIYESDYWVAPTLQDVRPVPDPPMRTLTEVLRKLKAHHKQLERNIQKKRKGKR